VPVRTVAFAVLVEELRGRQTGGQVCAPVARDLVAQIFPPTRSAPPAGKTLLGTFIDRGRRALEGWLRGGRTAPH